MKNKALEKLYNTHKDDINTILIINVWLEEFFGTSFEEVEKQFAKEYDLDLSDKTMWPNDATRKFYLERPVTQEQHDWWEKEVIKVLAKKFHKSQRFIRDHFWAIYLDTAPSIVEETKNNHSL